MFCLDFLLASLCSIASVALLNDLLFFGVMDEGGSVFGGVDFRLCHCYAPLICLAFLV